MSNHKKEPWYAARCVFRHYKVTPIHDCKYVYEERIILVRAEDMEQAIRIAEKEAREYAAKDSEYLGYVNIFHLFESIVDHKMEVYSLMRSSDLEADDYLDHFFDSGNEHTM